MPFKSNFHFLSVNEPYTSLPSHVTNSLKKMIKNVQITGDSIDEDDLDEAVGFYPAIEVDYLSYTPKVARAREQHEKEFAEAPKKEVHPSSIEVRYVMLNLSQAKGKAKARDDDEHSVDSMEMDVDMRGSDFEEEEAPPPKPKRAATSRTTATRGKKKAQQSESEDYEEEEEEPAPKKKATARTKKEPAKKQPAPKKQPAKSTRTKKVVVR